LQQQSPARAVRRCERNNNMVDDGARLSDISACETDLAA